MHRVWFGFERLVEGEFHGVLGSVHRLALDLDRLGRKAQLNVGITKSFVKRPEGVIDGTQRVLVQSLCPGSEASGVCLRGSFVGTLGDHDDLAIAAINGVHGTDLCRAVSERNPWQLGPLFGGDGCHIKPLYRKLHGLGRRIVARFDTDTAFLRQGNPRVSCGDIDWKVRLHRGLPNRTKGVNVGKPRVGIDLEVTGYVYLELRGSNGRWLAVIAIRRLNQGARPTACLKIFDQHEQVVIFIR
ncbi:unnamed protein product [Pseudo-nitzschia multistriata]|uniref:Uncharacterized protein n=1 Tax=Pseudo-nitzschia multistriata TaxID=183589 RepID=A0A448ZDK7_9STRA|nr:unnamed protein product [Pseudo-nitzschia multistriata]